MSEEPDRPRTVALIEALDVPRNAKVGFSAGAVLALAAYAYRIGEVLGPVRADRGSPLLFSMLAFVLAVSAGALLTAALTVRSALRLAREAE